MTQINALWAIIEASKIVIYICTEIKLLGHYPVIYNLFSAFNHWGIQIETGISRNKLNILTKSLDKRFCNINKQRDK